MVSGLAAYAMKRCSMKRKSMVSPIYSVSDRRPETTFEELDGERGFGAQNTGDQIVCRIFSLSIWSIGVYILLGDFIRREEFPARFQLVGLLRMKFLKFCHCFQLLGAVSQKAFNLRETVPGNLVLAIQRNCLLQMRQRYIGLLKRRQDRGKSQVRLLKLRIIFERQLKVLLSILELPGLAVNLGKFIRRIRIQQIACEFQLKFPNGCA